MSKARKVIAVGSTSVVKVQAVQLAAPDATILPMPITSCVPEQPNDKEITQKGSVWRAQQAWKMNSEQSKIDYAIGIENGIYQESDGKWYDIASIVIIYEENSEIKEVHLWSETLEVPQKFIKDCTNPKGEIFKNWHESKDPHLELSGRSRVDFLFQPILKFFLTKNSEIAVAAVENFRSTLKDGSPVAIGVITALTRAIALSKAMTLLHLNRDLDIASQALCQQNNSIAVQSLCDLFKKYVTRTWDDLQNFALLKEKLIKRGEQFKANAQASTAKIAKAGISFIRDGMTVLTHGYSKVVLELLITAKQQGKRFVVYVTESRPVDQATKTVEALAKENVPVTIIADTAAAHYMSSIDLILVGAVHVVENGGVLNEVGTYQLSIVAKAFRKPFYVAVQSYKFTRKLYPLNQKEIPDNKATLTELPKFLDLKKSYPQIEILRPDLDYTPPSYLTLLFTDLGVLTPSAVSDELIKLYT